jgi:hypothetical protein
MSKWNELKVDIRIMAVVFAMATFTGCVKESIHGPSQLRNILRLMDDIAMTQEKCFISDQKFCSFLDSRIQRSGRWGEFSAESGTTARFETVKLTLALAESTYCIGAVGLGASPSILIWRSRDGKEIQSPPLDGSVPKECPSL